MLTKIAGFAGVVGLALLTGVASQAGVWLWDNVLEEKAYVLMEKGKKKRCPVRHCKLEVV